jgi:hypothetical protein
MSSVIQNFLYLAILSAFAPLDPRLRGDDKMKGGFSPELNCLPEYSAITIYLMF